MNESDVSVLQRIKTLFGCALPTPFIEYITGQTDEPLKPNFLQIESLGAFGEYSVDEFIPLNQILERKSRIEGFDSDYIPFAAASGGDVFVFNTSDAMRVYLWSHENLFQRLKVCDTFGSFLEVIKFEEIAIPDCSSGSSSKVWVDPEFREKYASLFVDKKRN